MDDKQIKALLFQRSERALAEISAKYSRLYKSVIREMVSNENDVEECANDVLMAVWESIPPNDPDQLSSYICTIACRVAINRYKYNTRQKRSTDYTVMLSELSDCVAVSAAPSHTEIEDSREITRILSEFIGELDVETRVLFIRRYVYQESVASLSERFAIKENAVSVRLFRARKKLKKILKKEGISV